MPGTDSGDPDARPRVWIVDDSPLAGQMAQSALSAAFDCELFTDASAVLERLTQTDSPDVLLLDWEMPGISGIDVCAYVRTRWDEVSLPVLVVTVRNQPADVLQALSVGANDCVTKPFLPAELLARTRTQARTRRQHVAALNRELEMAAAVRASEAELRLVTDSLPVLVSFVDSQECYRFVNKAYEAWFGLSGDQLRGRTVREVIGEVAYQVLGPYVRRGLAGERLSFEQHNVPYRHGGNKDVAVQFVPHLNEAGGVDGYVALLKDITAERQQQAEREWLAQQRNEVLESMGDGFFALDNKWRVVMANRRYEDMTGKPREQTLGQDFWQLFPDASSPERPYRELLQRCMQERIDVHFVDYRAVADAWIDLRAYPTADGGLAVFFRDISAEKRLEQLARQQASFEQQLIGIVSHDLRTPLSVITLAASLLASDNSLNERATRGLARIQSAAGRATRMVRDLLDFTQARLAGGIPIEPRQTTLHTVVNEVVEELTSAFPERELTVRHEGVGEGMWDPDRLEQVVQNLVTNALKYSPSDSRVTVTTGTDQDCAWLTVHNTGLPIPQDKLPILFEPMQRAVSHGDNAGRSVGLGLYIVRQLVEAHRGTVSVRSNEREGTSFMVRLPVCEVAQQDVERAAGQT